MDVNYKYLAALSHYQVRASTSLDENLNAPFTTDHQERQEEISELPNKKQKFNQRGIPEASAFSQSHASNSRGARLSSYKIPKLSNNHTASAEGNSAESMAIGTAFNTTKHLKNDKSSTSGLLPLIQKPASHSQGAGLSNYKIPKLSNNHIASAEGNSVESMAIGTAFNTSKRLKNDKSSTSGLLSLMQKPVSHFGGVELGNFRISKISGNNINASIGLGSCSDGINGTGLGEDGKTKK